MQRGARSTGDFSPNPIEKAGYVLDFQDEFDSSEIDPQKWVPYYLPQWSSRAQATHNYTFGDGNLILEIKQDQPPWSPEFDGAIRASSIQTGLFAGSVGSKQGQCRFSDELIVREAQTNVQLYTPRFGYFETRVKGVASGGNHVSLWMIGYEEIPEHSGEICVFELLGSEAGATASKVRYGVHPWSDPDLRDEFYIEEFPIDTTRFHIYGVEWTPTHIDFFLDNVKIKRINQSLHYSMQFMLSIFELPFAGAWNGPYDPHAPYPKQFIVDYLRGYQPTGGYRT